MDGRDRQAHWRGRKGENTVCWKVGPDRLSLRDLVLVTGYGKVQRDTLLKLTN